VNSKAAARACGVVQPDRGRRVDDDARKPSFAIARVGSDVGVRFAGIPLGHEFTSLVLALLQVGGHPPKISEQVRADRRARRRLPVRNLLLAVVPELPGRGAGAEHDQRAQSPHRHVAIDGALNQAKSSAAR
jgi:alkyl hydroperoxide reductase subunit F